MIKPVIGIIALLAVAGCATLSDKEARCQCFKKDGSKSGLCNFKPLTGQPAVFTLLPAGQSAPRRDTSALGRELCGG